MGEAKQRRAAMEMKTFKMADLAKMGSMCAWNGCGATYEETPDGQPPPGWRILYLLKHYSFGKLANDEPALRVLSSQAGMERDCVLCPKHAKQLDEGLLIPLGRELLGPAQGNA